MKNKLLFIITAVIMLPSMHAFSQRAISFLGSTTSSASGTSKLSSFNWNIPSGTNRMMVLNFYFERDFRGANDGGLGGNWPSTYHPRVGQNEDYFDPFKLSVGGVTPKLIRATSASWSGIGQDKQIDPDQAQFGAIMYRYVLSDADGLPSGSTNFDFSGIIPPTNTADEVAVCITVYNNVSPIISYNNNYSGVSWISNAQNSNGNSVYTNNNTFSLMATGLITPGRSASDFWYEGWAGVTKWQSLSTNWNQVQNVLVENGSGTAFSKNVSNEPDGLDMLIAYTNNESSVPSITMTRPGNDATYIMNARLSVLTLTPLAMPSISGNVFWDTDGVTNINGDGTNGDGLFVNVLDASNNVVYAASVGSDGSYTIPKGYVTETYTYTLQLSKNKGTIGSSAPVKALNDGWVTVGESSSSIGNDGTPDGLLSTGAIGTTNITGMNFGINNPTALPITYLKPLWAKAQNKSILLGWTTSQEINNKYFDIQHSSDGQNSWISIGTINSYFANGNGNGHEYSYTDNSPYNGVNYYRLIQYDLDGKNSTSNIVSINSNAITFSIAPNPASNTINVSGVTVGATIRIYSTEGKMARQKIATSTTEIMEISSLAPGIYILQVIDKNNGKKSIKFMKK